MILPVWLVQIFQNLQAQNWVVSAGSQISPGPNIWLRSSALEVWSSEVWHRVTGHVVHCVMKEGVAFIVMGSGFVWNAGRHSAHFYKMSGATYPVMWHHITSHQNPLWQCHCEDKKWCNCDLFSGHSFGSAVAYVYSALFPDDVEAYVSIDCVRSLIMVQKEDLLERIRYSLDRSLAVEKRLAFDPPSYSYEELRDLVHIGSIKSLSPESCDKLLERGMKKLPADDRWGARCMS